MGYVVVVVSKDGFLESCFFSCAFLSLDARKEPSSTMLDRIWQIHISKSNDTCRR